MTDIYRKLEEIAADLIEKGEDEDVAFAKAADACEDLDANADLVDIQWQ